MKKKKKAICEKYFRRGVHGIVYAIIMPYKLRPQFFLYPNYWMFDTFVFFHMRIQLVTYISIWGIVRQSKTFQTQKLKKKNKNMNISLTLTAFFFKIDWNLTLIQSVVIKVEILKSTFIYFPWLYPLINSYLSMYINNLFKRSHSRSKH